MVKSACVCLHFRLCYWSFTSSLVCMSESHTTSRDETVTIGWILYLRHHAAVAWAKCIMHSQDRMKTRYRLVTRHDIIFKTRCQTEKISSSESKHHIRISCINPVLHSAILNDKHDVKHNTNIFKRQCLSASHQCKEMTEAHPLLLVFVPVFHPLCGVTKCTD